MKFIDGTHTFSARESESERYSGFSSLIFYGPQQYHPKLEVISGAEEFVFCCWTECDLKSWVLDFKMLNSEHPRNQCVPTK